MTILKDIVHCDQVSCLSYSWGQLLAVDVVLAKLDGWWNLLWRCMWQPERIIIQSVFLFLFCHCKSRSGMYQWGVTPSLNICKFARKFVKSQPCCKRVGHIIFCDHILVTIVVGQLVKTPPPQLKVSRHITDLDLNLTVLLIFTFINIVFYTYRKLQRRFDLYYYDGLARQDEEIRLTIGEHRYNPEMISIWNAAIFPTVAVCIVNSLFQLLLSACLDRISFLFCWRCKSQ